MKKRFLPSAGMSLFSLPTGRLDRANRKRSGIMELGTVSASHALSQTGVMPDRPMLYCGRRKRAVNLIRALVARSELPFLLVGTQRDLDDSCLLSLGPDWTTGTPAARLRPGTGALILDPADSSTYLCLSQYLPKWTDHLVILCLGTGLQLDGELLDQLNGLGRYILLCESLARSIRSSDSGRLGIDVLLESMDYILVSGIGTSAGELQKVLPSFEREQVTNTVDFSTHRRESGMLGSRRHDGDCGGFGFSQSKVLETKPILTEDQLTQLQDENAMIVHNALARHTWIAKIR